MAREAKLASEESPVSNDSLSGLHDDLLSVDGNENGKSSKTKLKSATKSYGRSIDYLTESHLIEQYLDQKQKGASSSSTFGQAAYLLGKSPRGDEAVTVNQSPLVAIPADHPSRATIDFTGVVNDLQSSSRKLSKLNARSKPRRKSKTATKHDSFPTEFDRSEQHDFVF